MEVKEEPKFNFKVLAFRAWTAAYTVFLAAFAQSYSVNPDLSKAAIDGLAAVLPAVILAFGADQAVYHYTKKKQP